MRRLLGALHLRKGIVSMIFEPFAPFSPASSRQILRVALGARGRRWRCGARCSVRSRAYSPATIATRSTTTRSRSSRSPCSASPPIGWWARCGFTRKRRACGAARGSRSTRDYRRVGAIGATLIRLAVSSAHAMGCADVSGACAGAERAAVPADALGDAARDRIARPAASRRCAPISPSIRPAARRNSGLSRCGRPPDDGRGGFRALALSLRESPGLAAKADIAGVTPSALGLAHGPVPVGDDCAAIPDGDGHLLFAIEGFINAFVAADPVVRRLVRRDGQSVRHRGDGWGARSRWSMRSGRTGKRRRAGNPRRSARGVSRPTAFRSSAATPICATRSANSRSPCSAARARACSRVSTRDPGTCWLLRSIIAAPIANLSTISRPRSKRRPSGCAAISRCCRNRRSAASRAAKDISQGGIPGTAVDAGGKFGRRDRPRSRRDHAAAEGVALERWLKTFPSFGFLLAASRPRHLEETLVICSIRRNLHAAAIGAVRSGRRSDDKFCAGGGAPCCAITCGKASADGASSRDEPSCFAHRDAGAFHQPARRRGRMR